MGAWGLVEMTAAGAGGGEESRAAGGGGGRETAWADGEGNKGLGGLAAATVSAEPINCRAVGGRSWAGGTEGMGTVCDSHGALNI